MVSNRALVASGLPQDVSSGMASRVLPRFQPGCMAATARIGSAGAGAAVLVPVRRPPATAIVSRTLTAHRNRRCVVGMSFPFLEVVVEPVEVDGVGRRVQADDPAGEA